MDKFPAWAQTWLQGGDQVSHGLNLALKLQSPNLMPLLLWDIVVSRPKIQRAMEELTFIHYARFVPSWDGTALMVTTEFDGPLEPYVMDFVIALGDVFDVLLSYVHEDVRPKVKLPVRDHPDEFWAFIQQWNRVPFMRRLGNDSSVLLPADFDYPLYSAYPGKTVIDIEGKREKLLPPSIDHPAATVDLADVQGNILHGYRAQEAFHVFYQVTDRKKARTWLSTVLVTDAQWGGIRTAERWQKKPPVMVNVGFTFAGLKALLPERQSELDRFPDAFKQGAEARGKLNGDVGRSAPGQWLFGRDSQNIHVVVSVYKGDEPSKESAESKQSIFLQAGLAMLKSAEANGLLRVYDHTAHDLDGGKVYFGYQDGIAQPRISGECPTGKTDLQPAASPGEFLLGSAYASIFGGPSIGNLPEDLASNGTFGALRLLEQDVPAFEAAVTQAVAQLPLTADQIKAKLLGRELNGTSLTPPPPGVVGLNAFDYARSWEYPKLPDDHDGLVCPAGAHIRRTNPRTARVAGQRHSRRLIRRGMPSSWEEDNKKKVGLLGLFIGASLERQFEFVQRQWIQGDLAASGIRGTQDPLVGLRDKPTEFRIPGAGKMDVPPLVTTRGSLYLLFPSLSMLRALDTPARPLALRVLEQQLARPGPFDPATGLVRIEQMRAELNGVANVLGDIWDLVDALLGRQLDSPWVEGLFGQLLPYSEDPVNPLGAPTSDLIKPLDPEFVVNPYCAFKTLRIEKVRAVWVPEHHAYWVLGYDDCKLLLENPGSFRQQKAATTLRGILSLDPPRHTVVRRVVKAALDVVMGKDEVLLKDRVNAAVAEALNRIGTLQQFDFVSQYGSDVPRTVFWRAMGVSDADSPHLNALAQTLMEHFNQPKQKGSVDPAVSADASLRLGAHIGALLAKAMVDSSIGGLPPQFKGTLIGELAEKTQFRLQPSGHTTWDGRELGFLETLMTLIQFALASMSGQFLLGTAMRNLLMPVPPGDPKGSVPWKELGVIYKNSKDAFCHALQVALAEARRFDTPVTIVQRYAVEGAEIAGFTNIPADTAVFAVVASANRDGQANLEQFQWDRDPTGVNNLALGHGIHECVGAVFQATMLPIAFARLMESMPDLELCDTKGVPTWTNNIYFRVLQALPVKRCP